MYVCVYIHTYIIVAEKIKQENKMPETYVYINLHS